MDLQARIGTTFVIVTHDQEEAMTVAHRIGVMHQGRLVQVATPSEIYEQPSSRWVAEFIGDVNLIEGRVVSSSAQETLVAALGDKRLRLSSGGAAVSGATVWVALRPEKIRIATERPADTTENCVSGKVVDIGYLGDVSTYKARLADGTVMKATVANATRLIERPIGWDDEVWLSWTPGAGVTLTG